MVILFVLFSSWSFWCCSRLRLFSCFFNVQMDMVLVINFQNFYWYFLIYLQVIGYFFNVFVSDLRDVDQIFFIVVDGNKCVKVNDMGYFISVDVVYFDFCSDFFDMMNSMFCFFVVGCCDFYSIVIFDFDGGVGFFGQGMDNRVVFIDNIFDFVWVDFDGMDMWCEFRDIVMWCVDCLFYYVQDMQMCIFSLVQCNLYDFFGDIFNFDIYLQCRDIVVGICNFEVYIVQVIFVV